MGKKVNFAVGGALMTAAMLGAVATFYGPNEQGPVSTHEYLDYNSFLKSAARGDFKEIRLEQSDYPATETIHIEKIIPATDGAQEQRISYTVGVPANENVYERLRPHNVQVNVTRDGGGGPSPWLFLLIPLLMLGAVGVIFGPAWIPRLKMRFFGAANGEKTGVTFEDIAGVDEAMDDLRDIIDYMKEPKKFRDAGLKVPRGLLLTGPPGNGKTLLAKAIAGEAGVNFLNYSGSDFGSSMFMGVGTGLVKEIFAKARKLSPCIIFIDEIDSVGTRRNGGVDGSSSAGGAIGGANIDRENTLNQLLVELDGFNSGKHDIVLIGATNRPGILDPALLRPGRIDRQANVPKPDIASRERILGIYLAKQKCADDVNAHDLAKVTYGFSGAELAGLVNEAALLRHRAGRTAISLEDIEKAKDKILLGAEQTTRKFSQEERDLTAFHEAGHALLGHKLSESFPVYKATIMPRGKTLGVVMRAPESDVSSQRLSTLKADLAVTMAGRIAEELIFGKDNVSSGAIGDFQQANSMARAMVLQYGMSSGLKPMFVDENSVQLLSQETKAQLDQEIDKLLDEAAETARQTISDNWAGFLAVADALLEHETLDAKALCAILGPNVAHQPVLADRTPPALRVAGPA